MKLKVLVFIKALSIKKATPRSINLVMAKCLYARGAYVGILSSWSLRECEEIDSIFASELRRSALPKPKTSINRSGREVLVSNVFPLWFNNVSATASTVS